MRKLLFLFLATLTIGATSCSKDDELGNPNDFEERLGGTWDLQKIYYSTEIPDFSGGEPTPVNGNGGNVAGNIVLNRNPNTFQYNLFFTANIISGFPIPLPLGGTGTWTTYRDNSKLVLRDENGEETLFAVIINEPKRQVYTTTISESILGLYTVEIDLELEFTRP